VVTPMRRRVITLMTILTAVVIAISVRTSGQGHSGGGRPAHPAAVAPAGVVATTTHRPKQQKASAPPPTRPSSVTVNGAAVDTMYGPVQVQVTVRGAHIVSAHAIDYPQGGGRDQEINSQAIPQLEAETTQAQSARIDTVSGATFTSDGYRRSLQSALDAAHRVA
jgi:uncharacterized protein with FMN-binding domain